MPYPQFFDLVPRLRLRDPLAEFLGAFDGGLVEYGYLDAVKLAGHSCPTLTRQALAALYGNAVPERGAVKASFREGRSEGVTGVIANVVSMLTGGTTDSGFKGLAGRFDRRNLMAFDAAQPLDLRFTRVDTGLSVDAAAHLRHVPADPRMAPLMQRCLSGVASPDEAQDFRTLWQARVRSVLLDHGDDPAVFVIRRAD
jgi:hypothetical protein